MTLRLLIVTYYFPPVGGGGVQRVLAWCRYLAEHGIEVTVLAPDEPKWVDEDPTLVIPTSVRMLRAPDPSPAALIPRDQLARTRGVGRALTWMRLQPRRFAVPDIHRGWRSPAVRVACRDAAEHGSWDVILSTSPPETTHLIAHDLAGALGIPWVADLRDSWLDLPHLRLDRPDVRLKHSANTRLAKRVFRRASSLTTVSEPLAADLRSRHPGLDVRVLPNGVDVDDAARAHARRDGFSEPGRFVAAYTGNFFGRQSPAGFLDAIEHAAATDPAIADDLVVRFVGGMKHVDESRIEGSPLLSRVVDRVPFLRHDDVLAQQAAADLLLLHVAPGRGSAGVVTGKLFEYLAARRPILALVPTDGTAAEWLARGNGHVVVEPHDARTAGDSLLTAWRAWVERGRTASPDVNLPDALLRDIDRRHQAADLAGLLSTVTSIAVRT